MDLREIRTKLDALDDGMLEIFLERMELADMVAAYKLEHGLPILDRTREREILAKVMERAGEHGEYAYELFKTLLELSKARQSELCSAPSEVGKQAEMAIAAGEDVFPRTGTIACQGVEGGNSQAAADKLLPMGRIMFVRSFEAVFGAVDSGLCKFGILPIENSSNGSVRAVYELLQKYRFNIVRGTDLCIRHELLTLPGAKLEDIKEIYSHEQAMGQCSRFLSTLGADVKLTECENTGVAAQRVADSKDLSKAAIASRACTELYGLKAIREGIQNSDNNYTRFICISKEPMIYEGANRISLILACENRPGALYDVLAKLAAHGVNMSKLESCPVTGSSFESMFFLELEASVKQPGVIRMLEELERGSRSFTFLGCYSLA